MTRVGIVGAEAKKWSGVQVPTAQAKIRQILQEELLRLSHDPLMYVHGSGLQLIVVSGHCPVGKELYWHHYSNVKGRWEKEIAPGDLANHTLVYDGGGVDSWTEIAADELEIEKEIYPAEVRQWPDAKCCLGCQAHHVLGLRNCVCECHKGDLTVGGHVSGNQVVVLKGYKSRNIQIAKAINTLYVLSPECKYCGGTGGSPSQAPNVINTCAPCGGLGRVWNGGEWVGNYAEKLGKTVMRIPI